METAQRNLINIAHANTHVPNDQLIIVMVDCRDYDYFDDSNDDLW